MSATSPSSRDPLMRLSANDLAIAPELGVLSVLDATLATAAYQLQAEHHPPGLDDLARGDIPPAQVRKASSLVLRFTNLRVAIREYRLLALGPEPDLDQLHLPF